MTDDRFSRDDSEQVDRVCEVLAAYDRAMRSRRQTVQVMPDRVEIIDCASGDYVQTFRIVPDESEASRTGGDGDE